MKINLISRDNGVGLSRDVKIIQTLIGELGHEVNFRDYGSPISKEPVDANIFVELIQTGYFSRSRCNVLIPNPEWYDYRWRQFLPKFQTILCKTKSAISAFSNTNRQCQFISFTSEDRYRTEVSKDYRKFLHVAGKSGLKGTEMVWKTWASHPEFPHLTILQDAAKKKERITLPNVTYIYDRLSEDELVLLQNSCGVHVCPSESEGFGHYIMEGMSCGSVVISTDGPPMNELVTADRGLLCSYKSTSRQMFAKNYFVDEAQLYETVKKAMSYSDAELKSLGDNARTFYIENDTFFKKAFKDAIRKLPFARADYPVLSVKSKYPAFEVKRHG